MSNCRTPKGRFTSCAPAGQRAKPPLNTPIVFDMPHNLPDTGFPVREAVEQFVRMDAARKRTRSLPARWACGVNRGGTAGTCEMYAEEFLTFIQGAYPKTGVSSGIYTKESPFLAGWRTHDWCGNTEPHPRYLAATLTRFWSEEHFVPAFPTRDGRVVLVDLTAKQFDADMPDVLVWVGSALSGDVGQSLVGVCGPLAKAFWAKTRSRKRPQSPASIESSSFLSQLFPAQKVRSHE